jgi:hypothetical protein
VDCRFDGDPDNDCQDRQQGDETDDSDPGRDLEGKQSDGAGDEQVGEQ